MSKQSTGLRKRSQITKANKTMFIWVALMSALVMICIVVSLHLIQMIAFNGRVIYEKSQTIGNLQTSNENVSELASQIRVLDTNEKLMPLRANVDDKALQVILDALPATNNSLSFGASLQNVLLVGPSGVAIKSITVASGASAVEQDNEASTDAVADTGNTEAEDAQEGNETSQATETSAASTTVATDFSFVVEGPETSLQELLQRLEKSIRAVYVDSISIQHRGDVNEMSVNGHVYYQLEKTADLKKKVVK